MRNAWMFHLVVIVAALVFCVRPVQAAYVGDSNSVMNLGFGSAGAWGVSCAGLSPDACVSQYFPGANWDVSGVMYSAPVAGTITLSGTAVQYGYITRNVDVGSNITNMVAACAAPGAYAGQGVTYAGEGKLKLCAPDLCYYTVDGLSISGGYALEPPNITSFSRLAEATGESCTAVDGAGPGGCPAGQADVGFGCMTTTQNLAILDALNNPVQFVDPCIAAGTCTPQNDPCIVAGTCTGTGAGPNGTAGTTASTGTAGATYVDPCIIAGTCTPAADPCIAAGTCTGTGTGAGGTAGAVNPCIAAGTCAGSGAGTGAGTGGATEATQREILKEVKGQSLFSGGLGTAPTDEQWLGEVVNVDSAGVVDFLSAPACPAPITYSLLGVSRDISYQAACDFVDGLRPLMLAFASISVVLIYLRGFTPS